jgi:hypothetical protein
VSLCRFHHRAVHEGGIAIHRLDDGAWRFSKRNGESLHSCAPGCTGSLIDWTRLQESHREQGLVIDATTAATRWRGEAMDYGIAIDTLIRRSERTGELAAREHPRPRPI